MKYVVFARRADFPHDGREFDTSEAMEAAKFWHEAPDPCLRIRLIDGKLSHGTAAQMQPILAAAKLLKPNRHGLRDTSPKPGGTR